jgi:hypothetical protein
MRAPAPLDASSQGLDSCEQEWMASGERHRPSEPEPAHPILRLKLTALFGQSASRDHDRANLLVGVLVFPYRERRNKGVTFLRLSVWHEN